MCERVGNLTVLFLNASARYFAPLFPIWLYLRFNVVSVCEKIENKSERELEILLYYFLMHKKENMPHFLRFDCLGESV